VIVLCDNRGRVLRFRFNLCFKDVLIYKYCRDYSDGSDRFVKPSNL